MEEVEAERPKHWRQTLMFEDLVESLNCSMGPSPRAVEANPGEGAPSLLRVRTSVLGPEDFW
jgi:hypothetical protein